MTQRVFLVRVCLFLTTQREWDQTRQFLRQKPTLANFLYIWDKMAARLWTPNSGKMQAWVPWDKEHTMLPRLKGLPAWCLLAIKLCLCRAKIRSMKKDTRPISGMGNKPSGIGPNICKARLGSQPMCITSITWFKRIAGQLTTLWRARGSMIWENEKIWRNWPRRSEEKKLVGLLEIIRAFKPRETQVEKAY